MRIMKQACLLFFLACIVNSQNLCAQNVDFGKSYINVSKGLNGGTIETGDTLEIRATFVVRNLFISYDSCAFYDTIPAGAIYIPGTLRILTNEGLIYKQFTDASADTDEGWITPANEITMNLGYGSTAPATRFRRGRVASSHRPSFFFACIMVMSYRIRVTTAVGSTFTTGRGVVTYKNGASAENRYRYPVNTVKVYPNYGMCSNSLGANSLGTESNGSFGTGTTQNRSSSANVPPSYTFTTFTANSPNDYYYGIANNTSSGGNFTTSDAWPRPDNSLPTHRIFEKWDIIGDHTGATNPLSGNLPGNNSTTAGYMLIINASYRIDSAFTQSISNLCPNTYYEISLWIRNICRTCGFDSTGKAPDAAGYVPTAPGDSSGVYPNLTFDIDGIDYFTTGNVKYTGAWVKKGFTFLTGASQTSLTLKLFNNAPGGGGNDWAIDDITVATCMPDMRYSPTLNPVVCANNSITINDTVRSFFNNYNFYKWQRSTDAGINWNDVTPDSGPASVNWIGNTWEYVSSYPIPPPNTTPADSGDRYRLIVATTIPNLSNLACQSTDAMNTISLNVINCNGVLTTDFLSFTGKKVNGIAHVFWTSTKEVGPLQYELERSTNGINFKKIGSINGYSKFTYQINKYSFIDSTLIAAKTYYRLAVVNDAQKKYSHIIQLDNDQHDFNVTNIVNPFRNELSFNILVNKNGKADITLLDIYGRILENNSHKIYIGVNKIRITNTTSLPSAVYILRVKYNEKIISRKVIK